MQANPFRPGFNQAPPVLAGRSAVQAAALDALEAAARPGVTPRPLVLVGARGVGKTVLLGEVAAEAAALGWPTASIEVRQSGVLVAPLIERLGMITDTVRELPAGGRLSIDTLTAKAGVLGLVDVTVAAARKDSRGTATAFALETALADCLEVLADRHSGLLVTVDEAQFTAREEMHELAATLQQHVPDGWPLVVSLAGLPSLRAGQRHVTYLERAEWHELGLLDRAATERALREPASAAGKPMDSDAVEPLVDASGGYPYAIQVFGSWAWRSARHDTRITREHALGAVTRGNEELGAGLYASRWGETSARGRSYLRAAARLFDEQGRFSGGEVAERLGASAKELSYLRSRLLQQGTLYAYGRELRFAFPGMAAWILTLHDDD